MTFTPELLLELLVAIGAGLGSYAAIRADLARLHERATSAHDLASEAHKRIDRLFNQ